MLQLRERETLLQFNGRIDITLTRKPRSYYTVEAAVEETTKYNLQMFGV